MSDQSDNQDANQLSRVNAELSQSLKRCRLLLNECRSKLAANSNEPEFLDGNDSEQGESDHA